VSGEPPALTLPARVYAGYPFIATVAVPGAAAGTEVTVQRAVGDRWVTAGRGAATGEEAAVTTTVPAGPQRLRVRVRLGGQDVTSAVRRVRARRPASAPRTAVRAGVWSGASGVAFRVAGRAIRGFSAQVPLLCPTPGMVGQFTTQVARAAVDRIRLAPDGSFVGAAVRSGSAVRVRGRLRGGRMSGGRIEMSLGACVGSAAISARRG
jgi:hypothetical protein